jgi:hypothetical protein
MKITRTATRFLRKLWMIAFVSCLRLQHKMNRVGPLRRKAQAIYEKAGSTHLMSGAGLLTNSALRMDEGKYLSAEEYSVRRQAF